MKSAVTVLCLMVLLAGCSGSPDTEPDARLRVTQHQTACCYIEGQMSYLQLRNESGGLVVDKAFRNQDMIQPVIDERLPVGTYTLYSWQRPFGGNPGILDPPSDECEMTVELLPQSETFVTAAFAPGDGCTMTRTDQPLQSTIPDRFAFREELMSCGEDFPQPVELGIQGRSPARTCFLEIYENGGQAEVAIWARVSERAIRPGYHRILPDRRIEVFVTPENTRAGDVWAYYQCNGLNAVDNANVFTLEGCTEPEALSQ